ncbi:Procollagen-lysine 2-oxoglutarate 5-dioxygenase [Seminavis robusta]|uniref:Procollagen-lysine 2-oxoglutarate 5-dioxygenase n=1 Tax=Seminavis robusta TaxID=568900 RepID=A0A9N8DM65_9STRA|nr:Procollagen-lysine 2-oxoglutarate 5-dioxygenase [Seminavis robusta]|eukprot:Sro219_g090300.1 Procollagen-lysine 2-oxoglutarate 5-dioxygenase (488) ;mRNA; r:10226-11689
MSTSDGKVIGGGLSPYLLPFVFLMVLQGSEDRKPIWNLLGCLVLIVLASPSAMALNHRPKQVLQRLFSGLPTFSTSNDSVITRLETNNDMEEVLDGVGGGAINEKKREFNRLTEDNNNETHNETQQLESSGSQYDPSNRQAHLFHALEGLTRYPNYLQRWQEEDIDRLETTLEERLTMVRQQKQTLQRKRTAIQSLVQIVLAESPNKERWQKLLQPCQTWQEVRERILDPKAAEAIFQSKMFSSKYNKTIPTVEAVVKGDTRVNLDAECLEGLLDEEMYDVFSFRLLSLEFCKDLRDFIKELASASETKEDLREFGRRPFNLDLVGLGWVNDLLFHLVMKPVARQLFLQSEGLMSDLDWRHGYIAGYSATPDGTGKPRDRLVVHTDDSECTLNINIGDVFEGGLLEFRGLRGTEEEGQLMGTFEPQMGLAVIHVGRHFHDVTKVTKGDRFAFIIWARSWGGIRSEKCPCCWLNRREGSTCICGARWN